jgi:ABC-type proline/glycine betaine transport system permease subunit
MGRVRALLRRRSVRVSTGASALTLVILASDTAVALAVPCGIACLSDRRLKQDVRAI